VGNMGFAFRVMIDWMISFAANSLP
jgi:hypothetical protein